MSPKALGAIQLGLRAAATRPRLDAVCQFSDPLQLGPASLARLPAIPATPPKTGFGPGASDQGLAEPPSHGSRLHASCDSQSSEPAPGED